MNLNKFQYFISENIHTVLFIIGLGVFIFAMFLVNTIAGWFALSGVLILIALLINNDNDKSVGRR